MKRPTDGILTDDLAHPQERWVDRIAANRRNVGVAFMARQDRKKYRPENIALVRRVRTAVSQRTALDPWIEQLGRLEEIDEKSQLPHRSDGRLGIPFYMDATAEGVDRQRRGLTQLTLTLWVNR